MSSDGGIEAVMDWQRIETKKTNKWPIYSSPNVSKKKLLLDPTPGTSNNSNRFAILDSRVDTEEDKEETGNAEKKTQKYKVESTERNTTPKPPPIILANIILFQEMMSSIYESDEFQQPFSGPPF
ncbi:uncharacterized protein LOC105222298 [Bactrocera dorsalis]|uniref:Uncharacterized protein LOC105222298 n=1 Tax=Bactrocera dorsalis TaxID=27457 RepID=A0ABM3JGS6_BACDO|nr:uncharacterized protein LOC105222298 [Bactrocera dorsalis]